MQSYYSQCFATKQTIAPGNKCFALAICQQRAFTRVKMHHHGKSVTQQGYAPHSNGPDTNWTPVSNFIEGVYRQDGAIEICRTEENMRRLFAFVRVMLKYSPVIRQGNNSELEPGFDLAEYIHKHCLGLHYHLAALERNEYVKEGTAHHLTSEAGNRLFPQLCQVWEQVNVLANKSRHFYCQGGAAGPGNVADFVPVQFALMHGATYDALLKCVAPYHQPRAVFEHALKAVQEEQARPAYRRVSERVRFELLEIAFLDSFSSRGQFDFMSYLEKELGLCDFLFRHVNEELTAQDLFERTRGVLADRVVMQMLGSLEIKLEPQYRRPVDQGNHIGSAYASLVNSVNKAVALQAQPIASTSLSGSDF